jgi:hypothetical protein
LAAINEDELRRQIARHSVFGADVDAAALALLLALVAASDELVSQGLTRGDIESKLSTHLCSLYDLAWSTIKKGLPDRGKVLVSHRRER